MDRNQNISDQDATENDPGKGLGHWTDARLELVVYQFNDRISTRKQGLPQVAHPQGHRAMKHCYVQERSYEQQESYNAHQKHR